MMFLLCSMKCNFNFFLDPGTFASVKEVKKQVRLRQKAILLLIWLREKRQTKPTTVNRKRYYCAGHAAAVKCHKDSLFESLQLSQQCCSRPALLFLFYFGGYALTKVPSLHYQPSISSQSLPILLSHFSSSGHSRMASHSLRILSWSTTVYRGTFLVPLLWSHSNEFLPSLESVLFCWTLPAYSRQSLAGQALTTS